MRDESLIRLKEWFPKGSTVYTILRHVSRSGMQRTIGVVAIINAEQADVRHPNYAVSEALGLKADRSREGVKIAGCGMDMGFELAYRLGQELYGDGYALKHKWL